MFSVPYNQDIEILKVYEKYKDHISSVYFSGDPNVIFAARKMDWNEKVEEDIYKLIDFLNEYNICSDLVMNSINDDNMFTLDGLKLIVTYVHDLHQRGLKMVTVANPILFKAIKENIPTIKIGLSIISNIYTLNQIEQFYEYGLDEICLPPHLSRNKDKILEIRKHFPELKIKMMANCFCRPDCISFIHHHIEVGRGDYEKDKKYFEYLCTQKDFNPLKKNFILPGETKYYEEYIDLFKLSGRQKKTKDIELMLEKYVNEISCGYDLSLLLDGPIGNKFINVSYINNTRNLDKISNCKYKCIENNCNYCDKILEKYFDFFE